MLPWAADLVFRRKRLRRSTTTGKLFTEAEKVALEYADAITDTGRDVDDELFARLQRL